MDCESGNIISFNMQFSVHLKIIILKGAFENAYFKNTYFAYSSVCWFEVFEVSPVNIQFAWYKLCRNLIESNIVENGYQLKTESSVNYSPLGTDNNKTSQALHRQACQMSLEWRKKERNMVGKEALCFIFFPPI